MTTAKKARAATMTEAPKRAMRMRQLTVWIPREQELPFLAACRQAGKSQSQVLREAVDAMLNPNGDPK